MQEIKDILNNPIKDLMPKAIEPINPAIINSMWLQMGKTFTPEYQIDKLAKAFISYFSKSRDKGLFIIGPKGVGKTLNFLIYQRIMLSLGRGSELIVMEVKEIEHNFKLQGQEFIDRLIKIPELVINDLGTDASILKHYGSSVELINEILILRYARWQKFPQSLKTHITTNLIQSDIEQGYGDRIYDRIKEMFWLNVVSNQESYRK